MRPAHFLRGNKKDTKPTRVILFDTETIATPLGDGKEKHILRMGVACFWRRMGGEQKDIYKWLTFTSEDTFWDWVVEQAHTKTTTVLSSHNLSFDLPILHAFKALPKRKFKLSSYYCKGQTTLARFRKGTSKLDFVDNTNFFPGTLASLAPLVGLEKLEVDFASVENSELETYCRQDVEILLRLWQQWVNFLDEHNLGKWRRTLPSQAFTAFQHRFMKHKILIHEDSKVCKLERNAYHGGRVEVLRVGFYDSGPYYKLDINSMYPYVMHEFAYPIRLFRYVEPASVASLKRKLDCYHIIADCLIETVDPAFPCLVNGHIAYPTGTFRTTLTTRELRYVLERGKIHDCFRLAYYDAGHIFTEYVDYFYSLKEQYALEGNHVYRTIVKGFLNYLYGKFGQRGLSDKIIGVCPVDETKVMQVYDADGGEYYDLIYIGGQIIRRKREDESYNSFPAIAAEVTANARLYLHCLLVQAGRDHVFYIDTDSLIVDQTGYNRLIELVHPTKLGQLRLEQISPTVDIRAPKDYTFASKDRIKGIRTNAVQIDNNIYQQAKFPSIQGLLRAENLEDYIVTQMVKHLRREIYGGTVTSLGFVVPFALSDAFLLPLSTS